MSDMFVREPRWTITRTPNGWGYFVKCDGWCVDYRQTLWGAKRSLRRHIEREQKPKPAHEPDVVVYVHREG